MLMIKMNGYLRIVEHSEVFFKSRWGQLAYNPCHAHIYKTGDIPVHVMLAFYGVKLGFLISIYPTEAGTLADKRAKLDLINAYQGFCFLCNPCKKTYRLVSTVK